MERWCCLLSAVLLISAKRPAAQPFFSTTKVKTEEALSVIEEVSGRDMGHLCVTEGYKRLPVPVAPERYKSAKQKADLAATLLLELGLSSQHNYTELGLLHSVVDGVAHSLFTSEPRLLASRVVTQNESTKLVTSAAVWRRQHSGEGGWRQPSEVVAGVELPQELPWVNQSFRSQGVVGWWTMPYYCCTARSWVLSYVIFIPPTTYGTSGLLSVDVDISDLKVNQCDPSENDSPLEIYAFKGSHKCHSSTKCHYEGEGKAKWSRGSYVCRCRQGFYLAEPQVPFIGTLVEAAWLERRANGSSSSSKEDVFRCAKCSEGCAVCRSPAPCLATYNWPFRIALLTISITCVIFTLCLVIYVFHHRRLKIFKVASPIFLCITLLGCGIMYLEMATIFPILDMPTCIATKWARHLGFCITYTALLMKTWRVSLTYRVKSAHKVKLTDKQLLQWMFPILLVMLIYLGTWTLSSPPRGEDIQDNLGLSFKQCSYNWWDHSIAIGEVLFLAWGIRVCYSVRNAESLFNEARLISYAIYNIALVNIAMVAFHLILFPRAGPDIKYLLGFIRTQLSTTVTIALVFGPKVVRVLKGQGDQWDKRARARAVTASFSLNGIGLVTEETTDLFQENEELKEEIQKLAGQIEFMRIVSMEMNNRHVKPKPGGYFSVGTVLLQSPKTPRDPTSSSPATTGVIGGGGGGATSGAQQELV